MIQTDLTTNTSKVIETGEVSWVETQTEEHHGPHIPKIQWETVYGPISNTSVTTIIFLIIVTTVSLLANRALKSKKKSRLKQFFLNYVQYFDSYLRDGLGDKASARKYFVLIVGIFSIVFFGNLFGLIIDWLGWAVSPTILSYMRPMHSDLNTTAVLALITVVMMIAISIKSHGSVSTVKSYVFNFTGHNLIEKCVNVFVGWLHFLSLGSTFASLSLRLFGNIFAGVVLLGVITYLGWLATENMFEVGKLLSLPFWFFELFVAFVQALVFAGLMVAYFNNSKSSHH